MSNENPTVNIEDTANLMSMIYSEYKEIYPGLYLVKADGSSLLGFHDVINDKTSDIIYTSVRYEKSFLAMEKHTVNISNSHNFYSCTGDIFIDLDLYFPKPSILVHYNNCQVLGLKTSDYKYLIVFKNFSNSYDIINTDTGEVIYSGNDFSECSESLESPNFVIRELGRFKERISDLVITDNGVRSVSDELRSLYTTYKPTLKNSSDTFEGVPAYYTVGKLYSGTGQVLRLNKFGQKYSVLSYKFKGYKQ